MRSWRSSAAECGGFASRSFPAIASPLAFRLTIRSAASSRSGHASHNHLNFTSSNRPRRHGSSHSSTRGRRRVRTKASASRPPTSAVPGLTPVPCDTAPVPFAALVLDSRLLEGIRDLGFIETRSIQTAVIPLALQGADVIATAETGSGKTAAFVVPMLQRLLNPRRNTTALKIHPAADDVGRGGEPLKSRDAGGQGEASEAPAAPAKSRVLVLAPTRELAVQIEDEIHGLAYHTSVTSAAVYGGVEMGAQERALKAGVDVIVATPGRLMDHMRQQNADLTGIELLVLDEADRMMDMGFWPDVRRIITAMPAVRQTLLFSATMPNEVVRDALEIVREPKYVQVGQRSAVAKSITHRIEAVAAHDKPNWLIGHLKNPEGPVLIFSRTKIGADRLARRLAAAGVKCTALHADRSQDQR